MTDRRYREDEVRRIFQLATTDRVSAPASSAAGGLTLAELQSIGVEVGVDADVVARAAAALDAPAAPQVRNTLGMPVEVGVTVPLRRAMTDDEWDRLVAELRSTFRAKGKISRDGGLREWRVGNLHAAVEPAGTGYRLRIGTVKGDANGITALAATGVVASAATWGTHFLIGDPTALIAPVIFGAFGIGAFLTNWLRLPPWARERARQMNHVAGMIPAIMREPDPQS